jgi:hypothetical protein
VDNLAGQLDAAAAGAELVELELEPLDDGELDFSDDELSDDDELVDSEPVEEPLGELLAVLLADSRLSLR